jgi:hypothetical protein
MNPVLDINELDRKADESARAWYERLMKLDQSRLTTEGRQMVGSKRREAARAFREQETDVPR